MTAAASAARSRPYLLVDVLDDFFAPLVLEVDVDVGRLVALLGDEALEQHVAARRVDFGDAQAIADRGVGGRAAALAQDVLAAREAHDVVDRQEVRARSSDRAISCSSCSICSCTSCGMPCGKRRCAPM